MKDNEKHLAEEVEMDLKSIFEKSKPTVKPLQQVRMNDTRLKNREMNLAVQEETQELDKASKNTVLVDNLFNENMNKKWGLIDCVTNRGIYDQVQTVKKDLIV